VLKLRNAYGRSREQGAVAVLVAVMLPLIFMLLVFAIDASNSWVHKRHLQGQVDAGVFAGALGPWLPDCDDSPIEANARTYGGDEGAGDPAAGASNKLSVFTGNTGTVHLLINSTHFFNQSGTDHSDGGTPCQSLAAENGHLDLKVTESNQPLYLGSPLIPGLRLVPAINAHARVEIQQLGASGGLLPIGVPDPNPVAGAAIFVKEDGTQPPTMLTPPVPLSKNAANPVSLNGRSLVEWDSGSAAIPINDRNNGVVIAFSGTTSWSLSGTLAQICNQPLVECYQYDDSNLFTGLSFIHGYSTGGGTPSSPNLGDVKVENVGCGNNPPSANESAPYFVLTGGCTVRVRAAISFGAGTNITVALEAPGCPNSGNPKGCLMTTSGSCPSGYYCTQDSLPTIPAGAGPVSLTINWADEDPAATGNKKRSGSFLAHRVFSANDDPAYSGPIEFVAVVDPSTGDQKNSVIFGSNAFRVRVGIEGNLGVQSSVSDPAVKLRVVGGRTSNRHTLDCDPNPAIDAQDPGYTTLWEELAYGCYPQYSPNTGTACPGTSSALWQPQPPPYQCVWVQTGGETNQVAKGLNQRIFGDTKPSGACPPLGEPGHNNWGYDPDSDGTPNISPDDPRALEVFLVPFGSFSASGSYAVPVTGRAAFYVSGYTGRGGGFDNPCEGYGDDPTPGPATIVGHFMHYVFNNPGTGTGHSCVLSETNLEPCIAVLTQ
jgi:hypothetical protein